MPTAPNLRIRATSGTGPGGTRSRLGSSEVFSIEERDAARDHVLRMAESDPRVVSAAVVGSLAHGGGDRWSDLDLTFGIADHTPVEDVLADWTKQLEGDLDALFLFDLPSGDKIYRVFLLPECLQMDLSFAPASRFGPGGPRFRLVFGRAHERPSPTPPPAEELFGWGVAYAREARACIERGRLWQAEHSISALREQALMLACRSRELPTRFGRGYDDLPANLLASFEPTFVSSLTREVLLGALNAAVEGLLAESAEAGEVTAKAAPSLRQLIAAE
jgi:predicted nucleotidyltransferase